MQEAQQRRALPARPAVSTTVLLMYNSYPIGTGVTIRMVRKRACVGVENIDPPATVSADSYRAFGP